MSELTPEIQAKIDATARDCANFFATVLRQKYEKVDGVWWLFSLDKPVRPLTAEEIEDATQRGKIPQ